MTVIPFITIGIMESELDESLHEAVVSKYMLSGCSNSVKQ